jgi:integrase/recombinase XerD
MAGADAMIEDVESYIALRRSVGFAMRWTDRILREFARFAARRRERYLRSTTAIAFARRSRSPERREHVLSKIRLFARHVQAEDHRHEVPPARVFSDDPYRRAVPFIFTPSQVTALVRAAFQLESVDPLRPRTFGTLFALLAATGLRISEALALRIDDITADGIRIRNTKFYKNRLVPLHPSTFAALARYLRHRRKVVGDTVFATNAGLPLTYDQVKVVHKELLETIGIEPRGHPRPRLHCLRHTFAVRVLEQCPTDPTRVAQHQLALMTYLGHANVSSTYWYLENTPQLLGQISRASERQTGGYP